MSRTYSSVRDEHQKQSKVNFRTYLISMNEPRERAPTDIQSEVEVSLLENCGPMRQEFRRLAQRIRNTNA